MSLVSVIVPIYNAARYLESCIGSIINSTYRNLQIILVDDGSQTYQTQFVIDLRRMTTELLLYISTIPELQLHVIPEFVQLQENT